LHMYSIVVAFLIFLFKSQFADGKSRPSGYRVDRNGLRPDGECGFVSGPAFGMIEVIQSAEELDKRVTASSVFICM
jgi:hypothetical protein